MSQFGRQIPIKTTKNKIKLFRNLTQSKRCVQQTRANIFIIIIIINIIQKWKMSNDALNIIHTHTHMCYAYVLINVYYVSVKMYDMCFMMITHSPYSYTCLNVVSMYDYDNSVPVAYYVLVMAR